jgi:hypothetical protein
LEGARLQVRRIGGAPYRPLIFVIQNLLKSEESALALTQMGFLAALFSRAVVRHSLASLAAEGFRLFLAKAS